MAEIQIASFIVICLILVAIITSILCRTTPQKPEKKQDNTLPALPIIDSRYQVQPVNGYPQQGNPYQVQQQPQLDAFTVSYMLQLIANQQRGNNG